MGAEGRFPYPKEVWSPAGGWWAFPKAWRINTIGAALALTAICIPIAMFSESKMERVGHGNGHYMFWRPNFKHPEQEE